MQKAARNTERCSKYQNNDKRIKANKEQGVRFRGGSERSCFGWFHKELFYNFS